MFLSGLELSLEKIATFFMKSSVLCMGSTAKMEQNSVLQRTKFQLALKIHVRVFFLFTKWKIMLCQNNNNPSCHIVPTCVGLNTIYWIVVKI